MPAWKKQQFFQNGFATRSTSAEMFNLLQKNNLLIFYIKISNEIRSFLLKIVIFEKIAAFWKKNLFSSKKIVKNTMYNNFLHIGKIVRTSVDNLVLQILLKFQVDRIKILGVLLRAELTNVVLRKTRLSFKVYLKRRSTRKAVTLKIKHF